MTAGGPAGFWRRFAALLYDALLVVALLLLFTGAVMVFTHVGLTAETVGAWVYLYRAALLGIIAGYAILNWMRSGQTLGMRAWRLRAVDTDGKPLRFVRSAARFAFGVLAWLPAALGVLWMYVDPQRLALHDRLSGSRVVRC